MVLAVSAVPIKDSVLSADPGHAVRLRDGALHILGGLAWPSARRSSEKNRRRRRRIGLSGRRAIARTSLDTLLDVSAELGATRPRVGGC